MANPKTFYGKYRTTDANDPGADFREPLATAFAFRYVDEAPTYLNAGLQASGTHWADLAPAPPGILPWSCRCPASR